MWEDEPEDDDDDLISLPGWFEINATEASSSGFGILRSFERARSGMNNFWKG